MTDQELIRLYLETQETSYFSALYVKYYSRVFAKCLAILGDHAIAQDATQEVFTKIFLNLSGFNEKAQFSTWIYSITYNYCIDVIRKEKKNQMFTGDIEKAGSVQADVDDVFLMEMRLERLTALLERIPVGDKAILMMKYQDDLSIREIGEICHKSESAIKMQLKRSKQKLKQLYDQLYRDNV